MRRRKWREGKVRPIPGNSPHDRLVSRVISASLKESLRRSLTRHCFPHLQTILGAQYAFLRHVGIYLVRCGFKIKTQNQTLGWGRAASRWSAPSPGSRTCREDHAPSHRPQMSSGRLFLDRVARQHCPSPLHRHAQTTTPPRTTRQKPDISILQGIGHFYFALTGVATGGDGWRRDGWRLDGYRAPKAAIFGCYSTAPTVPASIAFACTCCRERPIFFLGAQVNHDK